MSGVHKLVKIVEVMLKLVIKLVIKQELYQLSFP